MRACLLLAAMALSGCAAGPPYINPNPNADRGADAEQCTRQAFARYPVAPATGMRCVTTGNVTDCQPSRGAGGFAEGFETSRATFGRLDVERACMTAKGW